MCYPASGCSGGWTDEGTQGANPSVCHWFFAADSAFVHSKWMMSVVTKIGEKKLDQPTCSVFEVLLPVLSHFSL